jgi:hypothetical protein
MSGCIESFLADQIEQVKANIVAILAAISAIETDNRSSYQLDTGQTRILVTRHNIATVKNLLDSQMNLLSTLDARVNRKGQTRIVPGW